MPDVVPATGSDDRERAASGADQTADRNGIAVLSGDTRYAGSAAWPPWPPPLFGNVDIAPLPRELIGLPPERDGNDAPFRRALGR